MNLFIAILVDSFIGQTNSANLPIDDDDIEKFIKVWGSFDQNATGYISCTKLDELVIKLLKIKSRILPQALVESQSLTDEKPFYMLNEERKMRDQFL